ncbi:hypothetical protein ACP4OV_027954 [Aristida adscensionis]
MLGAVLGGLLRCLPWSSPTSASPDHRTTQTASTCTPRTARGTHVFEVAGFSLLRGLGAGKFVSSPAFAVGGHTWCVRYYPDGDGSGDAAYDLGPIDPITGASPSVLRKRRAPVVFDTVGASTRAYGWGTNKFMKTTDLEASVFLHDDRLAIKCDVTVIKEAHVVLETSRRASYFVDEVAPPDLDVSEALATLLETKEGADVTFIVEGEVFAAHATVLAMSSSVFRAELFGPYKEGGDQRQAHIAIDDMQAAVFRGLLQFIYTGDVEDIGGDDGDGRQQEILKHLLVAADRYDVQGLKLACERLLCESLGVDNVAAMFALADRHSCGRLQDACVEFVACSDKLCDVVASKGYGHLKSLCPAVLLDLFEKAAKSRKI